MLPLGWLLALCRGLLLCLLVGLCGVVGTSAVTGRTERAIAVAEQRIAAVLAVLVGHRRPLQQQFAHALGLLALLLVLLEFLAELLPLGLLVELLAHERRLGLRSKKAW